MHRERRAGEAGEQRSVRRSFRVVPFQFPRPTKSLTPLFGQPRNHACRQDDSGAAHELALCPREAERRRPRHRGRWDGVLREEGTCDALLPVVCRWRTKLAPFPHTRTIDPSASVEALRGESGVYSYEPRSAAGDDLKEAGEHELPHQRPANEAATTSKRKGLKSKLMCGRLADLDRTCYTGVQLWMRTCHSP